MSLINQVLQDLEKRHASGAERGALPNQVRVLPRAEKSRTLSWMLSGLMALGLISALAWQLHLRPASDVTSSAATPALPEPRVHATAAASRDGPASRLALELEYVPSAEGTKTAATPELVPAQEGTALRTVSVLQVANANSGTAREPDNVPTQVRSRPTAPVSSAKVPAAAQQSSKAEIPAQPSQKPDPPATKPTEVETIKSGNVAVPPVAVAKLPVTPAKSTEHAVDTKVVAALTYPQIDKRAQQLTPPQLAENEYRDAVSLLNQGRLAEAQEGFRRALQGYPGHTGARQGLFGLLMEAQKSSEAELVLQEGLKLNPGQPGFAMALARLQLDRGNTAAAIETMQKAAAAAASSPDYLAFLAALLQRQARHADAVENYRAALRLAPGSGVWLMGLAISLQAMHRNGEAQDAFRNARATNTLNPELQAFVDQRLRQLQ